jgi:hypothetical protein
MVLVVAVLQLLDLKIGYGVCIELSFMDFIFVHGVLPRMKMNPERMPL